MGESTIWVLVADATRARVFATEKRNGELLERFDLVNPEGRLHEGDLATDQSGRTANSATGMRHSLGRAQSLKPRAAQRFAREVSDRLEKERTRGAFGKLYVVAAPSFLGLLRKAMDEDTADRVAGEVDKDLSRASAREVRRALPDFL